MSESLDSSDSIEPERSDENLLTMNTRNMEKGMKIIIYFVLGIFYIVLTFAIIGNRSNLPNAKRFNENEAVFSGILAYNHLKIIAEKTHPTGSLQNIHVFLYLRAIVRHLQELAIENGHNLETTLDQAKESGDVLQFYFKNFLVRLSGKSRRAIMISAHFDSRVPSPGATDNGAGVSVALEV